jgi:hypothetical protein
MPNALKGVRVDGQAYHFDHNYLDNDPIPDFLPATDTVRVSDAVLGKSRTDDSLMWRYMLPNGGYSDGDVLTVGNNGEVKWDTVIPQDGNPGEVISMGSNGELEWTTVESGGGGGGGTDLPDYDDISSDHVLVVDGSGLEWREYQPIPVAGCEWGAILMCSDDFDDGVGWVGITDALPSFDTADVGKVLTVYATDNDDGVNIDWRRVLPEYDSTDNGKVLRVVNGHWTLVEPALIYSGEGNPDDSAGKDGDIYIQTETE